MPALHIVQGGVKNGDKEWIETEGRNGAVAPGWVAPKSVEVGDDAVIYVGGFGFFATGKVKSTAEPREDWKNRYGAAVGSIKLIEPPISLGIIQRDIPELTWANYPRSITTPSEEVAEQIRTLIRKRRVNGVLELSDEDLQGANLQELRLLALKNASPTATKKQRVANYRTRSLAIALYVLARAEGYCEGCEYEAPFVNADGSAYLEPHHVERLGDDGPDHPAKVIALCPNCHRKAHYAKNAKEFNNSLIRRLGKLELA